MFRKRGVEQEPIVEQLGVLGQPADLGGIALGGANERLLGRLESLDKPIARFDTNWTEANDRINGFLSDPENYEMLTAAISEYNHNHEDPTSQSRAHNRAKRKMSERDLPDFVAAHVGLARLESYHEKKDAILSDIDAGRISVRDVLKAGSQSTNDTNRIRSKWLAVVETVCEHTPTATEFYKQVVGLGESLRGNYGKTAKSRREIYDSITGFVKDNPAQALELIDNIGFLSESDDKNHVVVARLLAADFIHNNGHSVLGYALSVVEQGANDGGLVREYLNTDQGDQSEWVDFVKKLYAARPGDDGSFADFMVQQKAAWPSDLSGGYEEFVKSFISTKRREITGQLQGIASSQMIQPTVYEVEQLFDRLMKKVAGEPTYRARKGEKDKPQRRARILPEIAEQAQPEPLKPVFVKLGEPKNGYSGTEADLHNEIGKLLKKYNDSPRIRNDIDRLIETISANPRGPGRKTLSVSGSPRLNGSGSGVFVANPEHISGLSVPTIGGWRVIYLKDKNQLGIMAIIDNHKDYEAYVRSL